jgi:integrase
MIKKRQISYFSILEVKKSSYSRVENNELDICDLWGSTKNEHYVDTGEMFTAKFPIIIDNNGKACEFSIAYIAYCLRANSDITGRTLDLIAKDLKSYYDFIEEKKLTLFHFPINKFERITTQYRKYLMEQVISGKGEVSTIKRKINRVVNFYEFLKKQPHLDTVIFENAPYRIKTGKLRFEADGKYYDKEYRTTDLAVKYSKNNKEIDCIYDEGKLRPLLRSEQEVISEYISKYAPRTIQLICSIAFHTGARLQTICTIRKKHIEEMYIRKNTSNMTYLLPVGLGTGIDTKNGKKYILEIPLWLVNDLKKYVESNEWLQRANRSFYKNTQDNYLFLTKRGQSFYTSKKEILDRKNHIKKYEDKEKFNIQTGEAVRVILYQIYNKIIENHKDFKKFRFHDFRATFGMNLLNNLIDKNMELSQVLHIVKNRMGHNKLVVTEKYLDYRGVLEKYSYIQDELENELMR